MGHRRAAGRTRGPLDRGPDRWVTSAEYIPSVIVVTRVPTENPVTSVPGFTAAVTVQVMLGVRGMSSGQ